MLVIFRISVTSSTQQCQLEIILINCRFFWFGFFHLRLMIKFPTVLRDTMNLIMERRIM